MPSCLSDSITTVGRARWSSHGDLFPAGKVGKEARERVVDGELFILGEAQDGGGGELLGDRADAEFRRRRGGDMAFEIGEADGLFVNDPAIARDERGNGDGLGLREFGEPGINLRGGIGGEKIQRQREGARDGGESGDHGFVKE